MDKHIVIAVVIIIAIISFGAGAWWKNRSFDSMARFRVVSPLDIQVSPQNIGRLPSDAVLYEYRTLPEITTYIMFVNLKETHTLVADEQSDKPNIIKPVDAYPAL